MYLWCVLSGGTSTAAIAAVTGLTVKYFLPPDTTHGRPNWSVSTALGWIVDWTTVELLLGHQFRAAFVLKVHYAVSAASASVRHIYARGTKCRIVYCLMDASPKWRQKTQSTESVRQILSPDAVRHLPMAIMQFCKASLINTMRCTRSANFAEQRPDSSTSPVPC